MFLKNFEKKKSLDALGMYKLVYFQTWRRCELGVVTSEQVSERRKYVETLPVFGLLIDLDTLPDKMYGWGFGLRNDW